MSQGGCTVVGTGPAPLTVVAAPVRSLWCELIGTHAAHLRKVWSVRSEEWDVRSEEWGVMSEEWGVRSEEWGVRSEEWGVRSEERGVRSEEWGVRRATNSNSECLEESICSVVARRSRRLEREISNRVIRRFDPVVGDELHCFNDKGCSG
jgi:hypothetical protein